MAALVQNLAVEVVVSPPMGAIVLGAMAAEALGVQYAFLEMGRQQLGKTNYGLEQPVDVYRDTGLAFGRPTFQEAVCGKRVGIVEDVLTTGKTTSETIQAVLKAGGEVVWVVALYNRGAVTAEQIGARRLFALVDRELLSWSPEDCALEGPCSEGVPINLSPGHGASYREAYPHYPGGFI
jgi:orotate phosphoribosyltransferase